MGFWRRALVSDFPLWFVGWRLDFGVEAFEEAFEEGVFVDVLLGHGVGVDDVAGEVGEDDAPGEGVLPRAGAERDVLALLCNPDADKFEGGFVAGGGGGRVEVFLRGHVGVLCRRGKVWMQLLKHAGGD